VNYTKVAALQLQVAVVVYGNGINARTYINEYKRRGCKILLCNNHCRIYPDFYSPLPR
jgi:hypothetical protein